MAVGHRAFTTWRDYEDGVLQVMEVMRLALNADLVTLSACSTGLDKLFEGEGMIGLTRAFFYAGARSLVVSLWNVNDSATAELMKVFYLNLRGTKAPCVARGKIGVTREWSSNLAPPVLLGAVHPRGCDGTDVNVAGGKEHPRTVVARHRLARLQEAWRRPESWLSEQGQPTVVSRTRFHPARSPFATA